MAEILIACSMLEDEICTIIQRENLTYPVYWMPRGLHANPEQLHMQLQSAIDEVEKKYETIMLGYCLCGGSIRGIQTQRAVLAVINCYDCVNMLMKDTGIDCHSLYFTASWLRSEQFIGKEYDETVQKRGLDKADKIYRRILRGYTDLRMMETKCYNLSAYETQARDAAQKLGLRYSTTCASTEILYKLLTHQWDTSITVIQPGGTLE